MMVPQGTDVCSAAFADAIKIALAAAATAASKIPYLFPHPGWIAARAHLGVPAPGVNFGRI